MGDTGTQAGPAVDRALAMRGVDGDVELLAEIVEMFVEDAPRMMADLRAAVEAADAGGVMAAAHAFKGSVSIFGAVRAAALAQDLESMGRAGTLDGAGDRLGQLDVELRRVLPELEALAGG